MKFDYYLRLFHPFYCAYVEYLHVDICTACCLTRCMECFHSTKFSVFHRQQYLKFRSTMMKKFPHLMKHLINVSCSQRLVPLLYRVERCTRLEIMFLISSSPSSNNNLDFFKRFQVINLSPLMKRASYTIHAKNF